MDIFKCSIILLQNNWECDLSFFPYLQFILNVRLDYRISCLLSIFKKESDENPSSLTGDGISQGLKNKNLENIWAQAQNIFDET